MSTIQKSKSSHSTTGTRQRPLSLEIVGFALWFTYTVTVLLTLSGCIWLICHYVFVHEGEFGITKNPYEPVLLKIHGAMAFFMLVIFGMLIPVHMKYGWRLKRNHYVGMLLVGIISFLGLTGYALYYFGDEDLRFWISAAHSFIGVVFPFVFVMHVLFRHK